MTVVEKEQGVTKYVGAAFTWVNALELLHHFGFGWGQLHPIPVQLVWITLSKALSLNDFGG
jgi:hypothetical protein